MVQRSCATTVNKVVAQVNYKETVEPVSQSCDTMRHTTFEVDRHFGARKVTAPVGDSLKSQ